MACLHPGAGRNGQRSRLVIFHTQTPKNWRRITENQSNCVHIFNLMMTYFSLCS